MIAKAHNRVMPPAKKTARVAHVSLLVRCKPEERAEIDDAIAKIQAGLPGGAVITLQGFVLDAALARARAVLKGGGR
jgi:uncharacterized protein (DUF1778 family)